MIFLWNVLKNLEISNHMKLCLVLAKFLRAAIQTNIHDKSNSCSSQLRDIAQKFVADNWLCRCNFFVKFLYCFLCFIWGYKSCGLTKVSRLIKFRYFADFYFGWKKWCSEDLLNSIRYFIVTDSNSIVSDGKDVEEIVYVQSKLSHPFFSGCVRETTKMYFRDNFPTDFLQQILWTAKIINLATPSLLSLHRFIYFACKFFS
jgi:hypothetical protein